jgi:hypothetical protein
MAQPAKARTMAFFLAVGKTEAGQCLGYIGQALPKA